MIRKVAKLMAKDTHLVMLDILMEFLPPGDQPAALGMRDLLQRTKTLEAITYTLECWRYAEGEHATFQALLLKLHDLNVLRGPCLPNFVGWTSNSSQLYWNDFRGSVSASEYWWSRQNFNFLDNIKSSKSRKCRIVAC